MDEHTDTPRSRLRLSSPGTAVLLGLGVLLLLGLVAAASRAHHTPGGHAGGHRPPAAVGDYLFSIFAVLMVGGVLGLVFLVFKERDMLAERRQSKNGTVKALAILMAFALIAAVFARVHGRIIGHHGAGKLVPGATTPKPAGGAKAAPEPAPRFEWLPVVLSTGGALVVLGAIGVRSLRRARRGLDGELLLEQEFEELVEDTLADLYAETDARRAIIACYARVERLFATYGLPRDPSEAPVEYLDRVLPGLRASGSALHRLTRLFEWAKFSEHDVDRSMRDRAIEALVAVRDELRANRIELAA